MWQRFTERARRVVFFAQEEAGRLGENYVSTEHLLLGLVREKDSVAARILDRMGVSSGRIRSEIERQITPGDGRLGQDMQLTPQAKRALDLAYDEARQLGNDYIGTEHLLLGLIRESEGLTERVLVQAGIELERARREVVAMQDADTAPRRSQFLEQWTKLPSEQQERFQREGIAFNDLPPALQEAVVNLFAAGLSGKTHQIDLRDAVIHLHREQSGLKVEYTVSTTVPVRVRWSV